MQARSTEDVLTDHIRLRCAGDVETDLARNYAAEVVLLCQFGVFRGRDDVRAAAARVGLRLAESRFVFLAAHVAGEIAFVEWAAEADGGRQLDGADSYVIRDGLIRAQTISSVMVFYR